MCNIPVFTKIYDGDIVIKTRDATTEALQMGFYSKQPNQK